MNICLTSKEIDKLINYMETNEEQKINWVAFCKKFKENTGEQQILDRTRQRLHRIKDQIYQFLLSPKDAFHQYNEDRSGKLSFDHFYNMMKA